MALWLKICGMTDADAVAAALTAGADAIGFVFAPSARSIQPLQAARLAEPVRGKLLCVAVTQHPSAVLLAQILNEFAPDILQTDLEDLAAVKLDARCQTLPVLRAGRALPGLLPARALYEGAKSGAGQTVDWNDAALLARRCELVLAGGLTPANVSQAIAAVRPYGVDVSSGVELAPGRKSAQKIVDFVRAARAAEVETGL